MKRTLILVATIALIVSGTTTQAHTARPMSASVALGQAIFTAHCANCHDNSHHMINDTGPALFGVVGRPVGSVEGYTYSPALRQAHDRGEIWTTKALETFLRQPYAMHPGTDMGMSFAKASDRKALVAYLKTLHERD